VCKKSSSLSCSIERQRSRELEQRRVSTVPSGVPEVNSKSTTSEQVVNKTRLKFKKEGSVVACVSNPNIISNQTSKTQSHKSKVEGESARAKEPRAKRAKELKSLSRSTRAETLKS